MDKAIVHFSNKLEFEIDSWDLDHALQAGERVIVIDARSRLSYEQEHIPNALNLPHAEMTENTTTSLDKDALYVAYCDGIGCNASTKGALRLTQLGFRAKELIGGIDWWKRDGYATEKATVDLSIS